MFNNKTIRLYAYLLPCRITIPLLFQSEDKIDDIHFFIENTMKRMKVTYKIGRIEKKSNSAWLLPQYRISEFLTDEEDIIVYSLNYGLLKTEIDTELIEDEVDTAFIEKKLNKKTPRKISEHVVLTRPREINSGDESSSEEKTISNDN